MPSSHLISALAAVNWNDNAAVFCGDAQAVSACEAVNHRLAVWAQQLEDADRGNPALSFVREMQAAGHAVPALAALALYKASASSMRAVLDTALFYTFFRTHPCELG